MKMFHFPSWELSVQYLVAFQALELHEMLRLWTKISVFLFPVPRLHGLCVFVFDRCWVCTLHLCLIWPLFLPDPFPTVHHCRKRSWKRPPQPPWFPAPLRLQPGKSAHNNLFVTPVGCFSFTGVSNTACLSTCQGPAHSRSVWEETGANAASDQTPFVFSQSWS